MENATNYIEALIKEMDGRRERLFYEKKKLMKERKDIAYAAAETLYHQELYGIQIAAKILNYITKNR